MDIDYLEGYLKDAATRGLANGDRVESQVDRWRRAEAELDSSLKNKGSKREIDGALQEYNHSTYALTGMYNHVLGREREDVSA